MDEKGRGRGNVFPWSPDPAPKRPRNGRESGRKKWKIKQDLGDQDYSGMRSDFSGGQQREKKKTETEREKNLREEEEGVTRAADDEPRSCRRD